MAGKYFAMFSWSRGMSLILLTKWRNKVGVTASVGSNITWKNKVAWEVSWTLVVIYPSWWEVRECETAFGQLCERKTRPYYNVLQLGLQRDILQHQQILKNYAKLSEHIQIPSSVTFAVIRCLLLMRLKIFPWLGEDDSPDHGSLPLGKYECLWPRVSCVKAGVFQS